MAAPEGRIGRNVVILVVTEVVTKALGLCLTIITARLLGVGDFGLLTYAMAVAAVCVVVPDFGLAQLTVRELARRQCRAGAFLVNISAVKALLYLPVGCVCVGVAMLGSDAQPRLFVFLMVFLATAGYDYIVFCSSFFRSIQRTGREALVRILLAVLWLATGAGVLAAGFGLRELVVARLAVTLLCVAVALVIVLRSFRILRARLSWQYGRKLLAMSLPMAVLAISVMIYSSLNQVLVGALDGDEGAGLYGAAFRFVGMLYVVPAAVTGALLPALSELWKKDRSQFQRTCRKAVRYLLVLAIALATGLSLLSDEAVGLIFGRQFLASVPVLAVLAFTVIPDFLNTALARILVSMDREKTALLATVVGALVALPACLILIPIRGPVGAAYAWLIAETTVLLVQVYSLRQHLGITQNLRTALRAAAAAVLMGWGVIELERAGLRLGIVVGLGAALYFAALIALGEVRWREIREALGMAG